MGTEQRGHLKRRNGGIGGLQVLQTSGLEPSPIRGALQEVVGVLPLVVHRRGTRSLPLSPHYAHPSMELDRQLSYDLKSPPATLYPRIQLRSEAADCLLSKFRLKHRPCPARSLEPTLPASRRRREWRNL